jgi:hypothetical protein
MRIRVVATHLNLRSKTWKYITGISGDIRILNILPVYLLPDYLHSGDLFTTSAILCKYIQVLVANTTVYYRPYCFNLTQCDTYKWVSTTQLGQQPIEGSISLNLSLGLGLGVRNKNVE